MIKFGLSGHAFPGRLAPTAHSLVNLIFPPVCAHCRKVGDLLCAACRRNITWMEEPVCPSCGRPALEPDTICLACREQPMPLQQIRAAVHFEGVARVVIHQMKYNGYYALARPLADLMVVAWPRWQVTVDLVLPIPLHPTRERQRGYNQSALLAGYLGHHLGQPMDKLALRRARPTEHQTRMKSAAERLMNVRDAFVADAQRVAGRRILLIDDVCTSGATLSEAAATLLRVGAASVSAYCLAHAARDSNW